MFTGKLQIGLVAAILCYPEQLTVYTETPWAAVISSILSMVIHIEPF